MSYGSDRGHIRLIPQGGKPTIAELPRPHLHRDSWVGRYIGSGVKVLDEIGKAVLLC